MAPQTTASHKEERLRHNALLVIEEALAADGDPVFDGLMIREIVPGKGNSMLVIVAGAEDAAHKLAAQEALEEASGWLRAEVAAALQRRRVPDLTFVVVEPAVVGDAL